ncbi:MAG: hypothetical protein MUP90_17180, partial [Gammaproteobacteria bacterium]|nr:hypothetical protein [Gammaproteobacteria bacterium]
MNSGSIVATSVANADAVSVAITPSGVTAAGGAIWDGALTAKSEAVGISGDGKGQDYNASGSIEVVDGDVHLSTDLSSTMASGNDTLTNEGTIVATSVAAAPSLAVSVAVKGVATSSSTASAEATAVGIDAGAGNDIVKSTDEIVATSVASANSISASVAVGGLTVALDTFDGGTTAESEAIGISGDGQGRDWEATGNIDVTDEAVRIGGQVSTTVVSGDDTITNDGKIVATSVAESLSAAVAVSVKGVAAAFSTSTANSRSAAIDAGSGNDTVLSNNELVSTSVANANAVSVTVTPAGGGVAGVAPGIFDGGTTAKSEAVGISGDGEGRDWSAVGNIEVVHANEELGITPSTRIDTELASTMVSGNDNITNDGKIVATSVAVSPAVGVSVSVYGVAGAISSSTAESAAMCIDAGAGDDFIENSGELVSTSVANADSVSVTVVVGGLGVAAGGFWDGGTTAKSEAIGITGDGEGRDWNADGSIDITEEAIQFGTELSTTVAGGNDTLINHGKIVATSVAFAPTVDVGVSVIGVAGAVTAATAESRVAAIDAGTGNDEITNSAELVGTSVAGAITVPVAVAPGGVAIAANSFWDGGSTAISEAAGISSDGKGSDWLAAGYVDITEDTVSYDSRLEATMVSGADTIDNSGPITVTSVAEAPSVAVAVSVVGVSAAVSSATADSRAVAIDAGAGDDHITNRVTDAANSGKLVATSVANANAVNVGVTPGGVTLAGNGAWEGGTTATSEAIGISGDGVGRDYWMDNTIEMIGDDVYLGAVLASEAVSGNDTITNEGEIVATSVAVAPTVDVGVSVIGVAGAVSTTTAESRAAAIDAGAGTDKITNSGELVATSVANADTINVSVGLLGGAVAADAVWDGGTTASSEAVGISGDGTGRNEYIEGNIEVTDEFVRLGTSLSREAATGNDTIINDGKITATSVVVAPSASVAVNLLGVSGAMSGAKAES